jgi:hypothetical protein
MHASRSSQIRLVCAAATVAALFGAATPTAALAQPYGEVGRVCETVVGLQPNEKHYAACVESLTQSAQGLRQGESLAIARRGCLAQGYRPNTSGLAECELASGPAAAAGGPAYPSQVPGGSRSYFVVSRETAFQRDQLACARLGFDPSQPPFGDCAADLRGALARASDPAM